MIDNQQVKYKISIFFRLADRLPFLFPVLCGLGGWSKKRQPGRADFGEVVRPAYLRISPHIPHISAYPAYLRISQYIRRPNIFLCSHPSSPHDLIISLILLYLRYN